jgi:hypothetical protein
LCNKQVLAQQYDVWPEVAHSRADYWSALALPASSFMDTVRATVQPFIGGSNAQQQQVIQVYLLSNRYQHMPGMLKTLRPW